MLSEAKTTPSDNVSPALIIIHSNWADSIQGLFPQHYIVNIFEQSWNMWLGASWWTCRRWIEKEQSFSHLSSPKWFWFVNCIYYSVFSTFVWSCLSKIPCKCLTCNSYALLFSCNAVWLFLFILIQENYSTLNL